MTNSRAAEASYEAPESDFVERLEALADRHYHHRHPFNALMHAGRLDRGDLRLWVANRYYYQTRIPIKDALIVAKAEDHAFRHLWMQRLLDHDGRGDPRDPGAAPAAPGGLELWRRLGAALGLSTAELESNSALLPDARAACDEYVERVRSADLLAAVAFSLTEHFASRLMQLRIEAWLQHYSFVPESALDYFKERVTRARGDAELALEFVCERARTEADQQRCLDAFENKCRILWRLLDAVYVARRRPRIPRLEQRAALMKLSALAAPDERGQEAAPGVLMVPERALSLNRTAYDLIERCDGRATLGQITLELAERHGVSCATVERDVATFVAELERRRILAFEGGAV
jgi:pyrroloquinoline-quinone synthase